MFYEDSPTFRATKMFEELEKLVFMDPEVYAPHSSVSGLPSLPVRKLPDIIAGGSKSEQKKTPQRLLPLVTS
jgi:hypothetical protein